MSSEVVEQLLRLQKPALKPDSDENLNLPSYFDWRAMNVSGVYFWEFESNVEVPGGVRSRVSR